MHHDVQVWQFARKGEKRLRCSRTDSNGARATCHARPGLGSQVYAQLRHQRRLTDICVSSKRLARLLPLQSASIKRTCNACERSRQGYPWMLRCRTSFRQPIYSALKLSSRLFSTSRRQCSVMAKRGCLFAFEGLDRAGKSTQAAMLSEFLQTTYKVRNLTPFTAHCVFHVPVQCRGQPAHWTVSACTVSGKLMT